MATTADTKVNKNQAVERKPDASNSLNTSEAAKVAARERAHVFGNKNTQGLAALFSRQQVQENNTRDVGTPRSIRDRNSQALNRPRHRQEHRDHTVGGETTEQELRQQLGWKANALANKTAAGSGQVANTTEAREQENAWSAREKVPGSRTRDRIENPLNDPTVGGDGKLDQTSADQKFSPDGAQQDGLEQEQSQEGVAVSTDHVPLESIVGPEAVITFKEKLQQVWIELDEGATNQLDVLARMPANILGQNGTELLMIESPQGIHFVAFLRNKNDFEILANFDRTELLPDNPSRQLIEAAIVAYEQLNAIFKDGTDKIAESVADLAKNRSGEDPALLELRMRWMFAKKRKRKYERWVDHLVGELDAMDEAELEAEMKQATSTENEMSQEEADAFDDQLEKQLAKELEPEQNSDGSMHVDHTVANE